jgi:hypothetical protein
LDFYSKLIDKKNAKKKISDVISIKKLKEAKYWLDIDKYDRRQVNRYLKQYSQGDKRWRDAYAEIIEFDDE